MPEVAQEESSLQRFIPKELQTRLTEARASVEMVGERRVVTMLFCDVKGSTAAAEQMDPEDWGEVINGAFEYMIRPIYRYEGIVARLMGDGLLAFFGAPIAHEDDPQRAILSGLDIVAEGDDSLIRTARRKRYPHVEPLEEVEDRLPCAAVLPDPSIVPCQSRSGL